ncbi:hypothetical protein FXO38_04969 [Capsicum annuum]|uniref:uncharacterized protein LOC107867951 isoform X1 n=2 Tax=Capsicum annuum TaxID=4072 RepID=UPI0007BF5E8E|nr:uncharacterized protein LOC107867951 isoform X1 [Capsicum annuum]KAF3674974.1 hypothetical protein FXO38_04969 [Capsicum annuum]KAF3677502.1 hypothetical protein FXO37_04791 [Capsicum annuum]
MASSSYYVKWEEVCVSMDNKGRREVHYYLKGKDGTSDLAVVGKEKKLRHMSYHYAIKDLSLLSLSNSSSLLKLRSRTQVINWLNSILPVSDDKLDRPIAVYSDSKNTCDDNSGVLKNVQMQLQGNDATEFMWLGPPWTCRKKRKHYQSFNRNGVVVSVHEFVYVLAEEDKKLVAYLDDIYEDSRGNKMVVVRWFHKIDEVGIVLPHNYNDREIFFSLCLQTLSIECIDGLASVLGPEHYEKFSSEVTLPQVQPFICRWQFDNDDLQPINITRIKGYWDQDIIKYLFFQSPARVQPACDGLKGVVNDIDSVGSRPKKRLRLTKAGDMYKLSTQRKEVVECGLKDVNISPKEGSSGVCLPAKDILEHSRCFTIGAHVEILSQDSGIRGYWLRAMIIKKHKNKVKVQYQDIKDADDEAKNLEEWLLTSKLAAADAFGARISGRSTLRPSPISNTGKAWAVNIGCIVDAWWHDGWWEGIVVEKESEDKLRVYLLGEKREMIFGRGDLRHSQEWLGDGWRNLKEMPELVSALIAVKVNQVIDDSCHNEQEQTYIFDGKELSVPCKNISDNSLVDGQENMIEEQTVARDLSKDNLLSQLRWKSSGKRRHCRSPFHKVQSGVSKSQYSRNLVMGSSKKFVFPSVKVDHDNCKYISDSVFTSVVSPLTSLVMSR